jgi:hypothetical protein
MMMEFLILPLPVDYANGNFSDAIKRLLESFILMVNGSVLFFSDSALGDLFVVRALSVLIGLFTLFWGLFFN